MKTTTGLIQATTDRATARENYINDFCEKVIAIRTDWDYKSAHGTLRNWHCIDFCKPTMEEALTGTAEVSEGEEISPRKFFPESRWEVIESEVECLTGYSPEDEVLMWDPCPREKATYAGNFDTHKWEPKSEIENLPDGWEYFKLGDYVDAPEMDYPMNQHTHEEITLEEFAGSAFDAAFDTENE